MEMLVVQGGRPLRGTVAVSGAKNAALPIMAATIAIPGCTVLRRLPALRDTASMRRLLSQLGVDSCWTDDRHLRLNSTPSTQSLADYELVRTMRASICVLGPLLASRGAATVSLPGGCNIGHRPIDLHLRGLAALGADISIQNGYVVATARRLKGATVSLAGPYGSTATGTCNLLTAAALADGQTVLQHAACEPEVIDLGRFLIACGANISGLGTPDIVVEGVRQLEPADYEIIPDRIETATWLMAAAITGGCVTVTRTDPSQLPGVLELLASIGLPLRMTESEIHVDPPPDRLQPANVTTGPFPGFPTDLQAQLTTLLCCAEGTSQIVDAVFPDRFMHAAELLRMGADIQRVGNQLIVNPIQEFSPANVMASDLRASAALVMAALAAPGESTIRRIYHLDRGYEQLTEKLIALGADAHRENEKLDASPSIRQPHWQGTSIAEQRQRD